ncbi:hypothetical protein GCK72_024396 [Caenorhabditis remanei]|uniref:Uncharacterized protein n=1 Tax=Caenorhabditis remanei TaxID=31234 RepID=A0A6A5FZ10_CAERE|nr:hypothetical protein GCK72_024396 [Caenorhabditis remanei]KAF1747930.1 hypothetical protein GCK72_024396 [Caenorhabditis remanei]
MHLMVAIKAEEMSFGLSGTGGFGLLDCGGGWTLLGTGAEVDADVDAEVDGMFDTKVVTEVDVDGSPLIDTSVLENNQLVVTENALKYYLLSPPSITKEPDDDSCEDVCVVGTTRSDPPIESMLRRLRSGATGASEIISSILAVIALGAVCGSVGRAPTAIL